MSEAIVSEIRKLSKGTRVRVPAGTPIIYDTAPGAVFPRTTQRAQTIRVHWMTHTPDAVYWAGAGGYWKGVELTRDMVIKAPAESQEDESSRAVQLCDECGARWECGSEEGEA